MIKFLLVKTYSSEISHHKTISIPFNEFLRLYFLLVYPMVAIVQSFDNCFVFHISCYSTFTSYSTFASLLWHLLNDLSQFFRTSDETYFLGLSLNWQLWHQGPVDSRPRLRHYKVYWGLIFCYNDTKDQ